VKASSEFAEAMKEFEIPEHYEIVVEPWPYGASEDEEDNQRTFQGLLLVRETLGVI
jgi:primary-amine oxidase